MKQAEAKHRPAHVKLAAEYPVKAANILKRLVDHRQADDRIDDILIERNPAQNTHQKRQAVACGKQRYVKQDVLHPAQEKDHADQKEDMVDPGDHVLGPQIEERDRRNAAHPFHIARIGLRHVMGDRWQCQPNHRHQQAGR